MRACVRARVCRWPRPGVRGGRSIFTHSIQLVNTRTRALFVECQEWRKESGQRTGAAAAAAVAARASSDAQNPIGGDGRAGFQRSPQRLMVLHPPPRATADATDTVTCGSASAYAAGISVAGRRHTANAPPPPPVVIYADDSRHRGRHRTSHRT